MIETVAPGFHDAVLLGAGIAAVYLVVALLQLIQLHRHQRPTAVREPLIEPQYRSEIALNAGDKVVKADRTLLSTCVGQSLKRAYSVYLQRLRP